MVHYLSSSIRRVSSASGTTAQSVPFFCAGTLLFWAAIYVYSPILPVYAERVGASLSVVGLIVAAFGAPQLLFRIPIGIWSDRVGRRKPFVVAGFLAAILGAAGLALFANPWALIAFRGIHGLAAATWVAFTALFASYFPLERSVRAMGLIMFFTGLAQILASWGGGLAAEYWGLLAPFQISIALGALGALCLLGVHDEPRRTAARLSLPALWSVGTAPLLLRVSIIACLGLLTTYGLTYVSLPLYAAQLGATAADQGNLMGAMLITFTLFMAAAPFLAERWGDQKVVALAMLATAVPMLAMPFVRDLLLLSVLHAAIGAGRGAAYTVLLGLSVKGVAQVERATAMGVFQAVYALGMVFGPLACGVMADLLGITSIFFVMAALAALGALLAARMDGRDGMDGKDGEEGTETSSGP